MTRIVAAAFLWFAMVAFGWEILVSVFDLPRTVGPVLGIGAALWISGILMRTSRASARPARATSRRRLPGELQTVE